MMDVPVEDEDTIRAMDTLRLSRRDDGIVEDAESHPLVRHGVVTGRSHQGVRRVDSTGHDSVDRGDRPTRGESRDAISASSDRSARASVPAVGLRDLGHPREILRRVVDGQLLVGGANRVDAAHALRDPE